MTGGQDDSALQPVHKAVIPAAGLGSRLLPITKEIPKEMLPIVVRRKGALLLKPILQAVFEQLYDVGLREFCVITGRGKRSIEDHFTPDWPFLEKIKNSGWRDDLTQFFEKLDGSRIYFVNQSRRRGFGDAVLQSKDFVGNRPFLVHAGDDLVISRGGRHINKLLRIFTEYQADGVFLSERVHDPRRYGVIIGDELRRNVYRVRQIVEKPKKPPSDQAVVAVYVFTTRIFEAIRSVAPDELGEIQLTAAIQRVIDKGGKILSVELGHDERRIEIGTPESYLHSLLDLIDSRKSN